MSAGISSNGRLPNIQQESSHAHLLQDLSRPVAPPPVRGARPDAIIVPATRPGTHLQPTIELSASLRVPLVVLCSREAKAEQVSELASSTPGSRILAVEVSQTWVHPDFPNRTSAGVFQEASANRGSDLSAKRNIGLVLARLHGWSKIVFIDDDIRLFDNRSIARLAAQLDKYAVAGMLVHKYPDNSVVCHARRLADLPQDVFVTGAVLGVRCNDPSFFPDIYNEDWFFFAQEAASRELPSVGHVEQAEYDPFACAHRARGEEFGDLLAEGLYALIGRHGPDLTFNKRLRRATRTYWSYFMDARREAINEAKSVLFEVLDRDQGDNRVCSAVASLEAAENQLNSAITADLCVEFLEAWREDLRGWQRFFSLIKGVGSTREALDFLNLKSWILSDFGAVVDSEVAVLDTEPSIIGTQHHTADAGLAIGEPDPASDQLIRLAGV